MSSPTVRKFLTTRGDFNVTSKQRLEISWNYAQYVPVMDLLNLRPLISRRRHLRHSGCEPFFRLGCIALDPHAAAGE